MAVATKSKHTIESCEARVKGMYRSHAEDIENNAILRFGAGVFSEMRFLLDELKKANGDGLDLKDDEEADV